MKRGLVGFASIVGLVAGCGGATYQYSSGSATVAGGREVTYSVDQGSGSISSSAGVTTVTVPGGSVRVEKDRVLLDGKEVGKVPEKAKVVAIDYAAGTLTVTADGTKVYGAKIGK